MLVVLEGPNKVGKSTVAKALTDAWQGESTIVHHVAGDTTIPKLNQEVEVITQLPGEHLLVYDRWWLSELVYGTTDPARPLTLAPNEATAQYMDHHFLRCVEGQGLYVLLTSPHRVLAERRDESDDDLDPFIESRLYNALASEQWWRLDLAELGLAKVVQAIVEHAQVRAVTRSDWQRRQKA